MTAKAVKIDRQFYVVKRVGTLKVLLCSINVCKHIRGRQQLLRRSFVLRHMAHSLTEHNKEAFVHLRFVRVRMCLHPRSQCVSGDTGSEALLRKCNKVEELSQTTSRARGEVVWGLEKSILWTFLCSSRKCQERVGWKFFKFLWTSFMDAFCQKQCPVAVMAES